MAKKNKSSGNPGYWQKSQNFSGYATEEDLARAGIDLSRVLSGCYTAPTTDDIIRATKRTGRLRSIGRW